MSSPVVEGEESSHDDEDEIVTEPSFEVFMSSIHNIHIAASIIETRSIVERWVHYWSDIMIIEWGCWRL